MAFLFNINLHRTLKNGYVLLNLINGAFCVRLRNGQEEYGIGSILQLTIRHFGSRLTTYLIKKDSGNVYSNPFQVDEEMDYCIIENKVNYGEKWVEDTIST